ncbi:MAG: hypothetical protein ABIA93_01625 [Candidatus Woesearchaeota archaeon]
MVYTAPGRQLVTDKTTVDTYLRAMERTAATSMREGAVMAALLPVLNEHADAARQKGSNVTIGRDGFGNIIMRAVPEGLENQQLPSIALSAHLDHPGFDLQRLESGIYIGRLRGGIHPDSIVGQPVNLHFDAPGGQYAGRGRVEAVMVGTPRGPMPVKGRVDLPLEKLFLVTTDNDTNVPYEFATPGDNTIMYSGDFIRGSDLDDKAGVAIAVAAFMNMASRKLPVQAHLVLTRAEEIGLTGAWYVAKTAGSDKPNSLPKGTLAISIDTSSIYRKNDSMDAKEKAIKIAEQGEGPVLRIRDRTSEVYDPNALHALHEAGARLMRSGYKVQQLPLTGGTCEGTPYVISQTGELNIFGAAVGIPLIGWHDGLIEARPEDERVNAVDVVNSVELLTVLAQMIGENPRMITPLGRMPVTDAQKETGQHLDAILAREMSRVPLGWDVHLP